MMSLILISLGIALLIQLVMFIPAFIFKTDKLTDMSYGLTFIILALIVLLQSTLSTGKLILLAIISIWAIRLVIYLFVRIKKIGKDKRFDGMREDFRKFLSFWILQGFSVWMIMIPSSIYLGSSVTTISIISLVGLVIWVKGLLIETIADYQKFMFKNNPKNKSKWTQTGLWKYSRHPNYFGEMLCWIGVYIFTFSSLQGLNILFGLASPIYITFILLFVTGIPKLEKKYDERYKGNKEYEEYKRKTSLFVLLPPKK